MGSIEMSVVIAVWRPHSRIIIFVVALMDRWCRDQGTKMANLARGSYPVSCSQGFSLGRHMDTKRHLRNPTRLVNEQTEWTLHDWGANWTALVVGLYLCVCVCVCRTFVERRRRDQSISNEGFRCRARRPGKSETGFTFSLVSNCWFPCNYGCRVFSTWLSRAAVSLLCSVSHFHLALCLYDCHYFFFLLSHTQHSHVHIHTHTPRVSLTHCLEAHLRRRRTPPPPPPSLAR